MSANPHKHWVFGLFQFIPTLFLDYHLSYFTSISSRFSAVLEVFSLSYSLYHHSCCKICCNYSKRIIPGGLYLVLSKRKARQLSRAFAIQAVKYSTSTSRVISEILSINSSSISLLSLSLFSCSRTSVSRSYTAL